MHAILHQSIAPTHTQSSIMCHMMQAHACNTPSINCSTELYNVSRDASPCMQYSINQLLPHTHRALYNVSHDASPCMLYSIAPTHTHRALYNVSHDASPCMLYSINHTHSSIMCHMMQAHECSILNCSITHTQLYNVSHDASPCMLYSIHPTHTQSSIMCRCWREWLLVVSLQPSLPMTMTRGISEKSHTAFYPHLLYVS